MPAETLSSQTRVIFMPPAHFSKVILQRGTIIMFMPAPIAPVVPVMPAGDDIPMPGIIPVRSIIVPVIWWVLKPGAFSSGNEPPPLAPTTTSSRAVDRKAIANLNKK